VGDPGVVFLDRINATQPTPALGMIEATNPCAEQPLLPFESCTLGSINLSRFATTGEIEWQRLREVIRDSVHFLDNVIDANNYPLPQIAAATHATRKIGLGVMGFADMLIDLGVPYDSEPALAIASRLAAFFEEESLAMSEELAETRRVFPSFRDSIWARRPGARRLRNATTTTVAPTGTISIIAGCSSGIEPLYAIAYERNVLDGDRLHEVNERFQARAAAAGVWSDQLASRIEEHGSVRGMDGLPAELGRLFPTSHDVSIDFHVRMQAAFQKHVHSAVSKTINLSREATTEDVAHAYRLAYQLGCKGVTVYRDGCRDEQVLAFGDSRARTQHDSTDDSAAHQSCPHCATRATGSQRCRVCRACGWSACG
jgi:ribonucleoside-diphosphate reductase alpha chain